MRRQISVFCSLVGFCLLLGSSASAQQRSKVTLAEDWLFTGAHTAELLARERGYFAAEGLEVAIIRGFGAADTMKKVAARAVQFGNSSSFLDVMGRAEGARIKTVAVRMQRPPFGMAYLEGRGIEKPKDLEGRKFGTPPGSAPLVLLPMFAKVAGFDAGKVAIVHMEAAAVYPSVVAKKVDLATGYLTSFPFVEKAAASAGEKARFLLFADYGLKDLYGDTLLTSEEFLLRQPGAVRGMVKGYLRGLHDLWRDPQAGVATFRKINPGANLEAVRAQVDAFLKLVADENFDRNGLGFADPGKMKNAVALIGEHLGLKRPVQAEEVYTNEFVVAAPREWRFPKR